MKNKIYVLIIVLGILLYMYILFFIPKIETLTYGQYKIEAESSDNTEEQANQNNTNNSASSIILIENIEEFSSNYKGEVALIDVTTKLLENANGEFKYIVDEYNKIGSEKLFKQKESLLKGNFGIINQTKLKSLITKLKPLEKTNINSIAIKPGTFMSSETTSIVTIILHLENNEEIELTLRVLNYVKQTDDPVVAIY